MTYYYFFSCSYCIHEIILLCLHCIFHCSQIFACHMWHWIKNETTVWVTKEIKVDSQVYLNWWQNCPFTIPKTRSVSVLNDLPALMPTSFQVTLNVQADDPKERWRPIRSVGDKICYLTFMFLWVCMQHTVCVSSVSWGQVMRECGWKICQCSLSLNSFSFL